ncbi:MAG: WecB/TagA/CpsF family glycosyltransferase [Chloroflexota bacterium]|nr:WecB/TagA/CpsF family glycosyltransferase [Chloroflexota bacterium]
MSTALPTRRRIGTLAVSAITFDQAVALVLAARDEAARLAIHFCTVHSIVESERNAAVRAAYERASVIAPDGMPLVWVLRRRGLPVERVCGPDFMPALLDRGRALGYRHYLYGGAPGVAEVLRTRMRERYPGVEIVGCDSPPFRALSEVEDRAAVARMNAARPDCVWVGLGAPKQDLWVEDHRAALDAPVVLAVGAAFDFHSGARRRAPRWMQRAGLEWAYRLASEPGRLAARYTLTNARFLRILARDELLHHAT